MPPLPFDRSALKIKPLGERVHDLDTSVIREPAEPARRIHPEPVRQVARNIVAARARGAAVIMMIGGHVVRAGMQRFIIDLMERGYLSLLAMNGAGMIHDFEFALVGATTESVARYIRSGQFGLWRETGEINDRINDAYRNDGKTGMGLALGKAIARGDFPHKAVSLLAAGYRLDLPVTVHVGIGQDIIHEHPNCDGAATGALSYNDFLTFTTLVGQLENGVIMNFGSAVMAPEVYLKALSMARNVAGQGGKEIRHFTSLVCDLHELPASVSSEPPKEDARYYFRPWKTMLARTVKEGGAGDLPPRQAPRHHSRSLGGHQRGRKRVKVTPIEELAVIVKSHREAGRRVVHCHGCFDLMHPGHIKYFQAAREMGDVLVVTVTPDRYVDKGPGRPVFSDKLRAESIAALACVDHVAINRWPTAEETLRLIRPDIYVKGQEFEQMEDATGKIQREARVVRETGAEMRFTHEIVFSSTELLNTYFLKPR